MSAQEPAGSLAVVGLGPGGTAWRTPEVSALLAGATDLVGYGAYLAMVEQCPPGQRRHSFDNREESERAAAALDLAAQGNTVTVVSSGDPGVYAMAAAVMEALDRPERPPSWDGVALRVAPGVSAAQAVAARAGAPLGHDFATISLSDNLKAWSVIEARLDAAAGADFVLALYNPASRRRPWQLGRALAAIGRHRVPATPVVVGRDVGRPGEDVGIVTLGDLDPGSVDMRTLLIVGSSTTRLVHRPGHTVLAYTPRRYPCGAAGASS